MLIVSDSGEPTDELAELCKSCSLNDITNVSTSEHVRSIMKNNSFDVVIINHPIKNENCRDLGVFIAENYLSGIILLVSIDNADKVAAGVEYSGIFVLQKPFDRSLFLQAVKLTTAYCRRLSGLYNKTVMLESKIEETQLIDRAKCVLIQYLSMTEPQAHRYIEKQAMDMRRPKKHIAESILNTYDY